MNFVISERFFRELKRLSKKYPSLKKDMEGLKAELLMNPVLGTPLGRDCYKIRLAISSKGQGKSGGGRVITCVKVERDNVYLLTIYDKSEKDDLAVNELKKILEEEGL